MLTPRIRLLSFRDSGRALHAMQGGGNFRARHFFFNSLRRGRITSIGLSSKVPRPTGAIRDNQGVTRQVGEAGSLQRTMAEVMGANYEAMLSKGLKA